MEGQNFFVYSDENDGIKCLYRFYTLVYWQTGTCGIL